jgi:hypothetical protein
MAEIAWTASLGGCDSIRRLAASAHTNSTRLDLLLSALVFWRTLPELSIKSAMAELYGGQFGAIQVSISHSGTIRN